MTPDRVHATPQTGHNRPKRPRYACQCQECGDAFTAEVKGAAFCSATHRHAFNNRRKKRGEELYDLLMDWRYDRTASRGSIGGGKESIFTMLCRMARGFREEDKEQRQGRKSWRPSRKVLARGQHTHLFSTTIVKRRRSQP